MSYEVLIATGRDDGADADKELKIALVYNDEQGNKKTSDYINPGKYSNRGDAYENGQMDICDPITFTKDGKEITTDDFTGVMIAFSDKDWQLDTIWVTNHATGKYRWKHADKFFGSKYNCGTTSDPYELALNDEVTINNSALREYNDFTFTVETQKGDNDYGTNDNVFYKLFDDMGLASHTSRQEQWGNQYETGETNTLPNFDTVYGKLSKNIVKVLIVKVGDDGWRPNYMTAAPTVLDIKTSTFDLSDHLPPGEDSLDTHHNWMTAPSKESQSSKSAKKSKKETA